MVAGIIRVLGTALIMSLPFDTIVRVKSKYALRFGARNSPVARTMPGRADLRNKNRVSSGLRQKWESATSFPTDEKISSHPAIAFRDWDEKRAIVIAASALVSGDVPLSFVSGRTDCSLAPTRELTWYFHFVLLKNWELVFLDATLGFSCVKLGRI